MAEIYNHKVRIPLTSIPSSWFEQHKEIQPRGGAGSTSDPDGDITRHKLISK